MRWPRELDVANLRRVAGFSVLAVGVIQGATATLALRRGRRDYADAVWGVGLAAVAGVSAVAGRGDARRRWGLAAAVSAWAARLSAVMLRRIRTSDAEDPRYTEFLGDDDPAAVVLKVFVVQGVSQLIVAAPVQLAAASRLSQGPRRWLAPAGVALLSAGAVIEALADRQKSRYSDLDADSRPDVLDTGLWVGRVIPITSATHWSGTARG